MISANNREPVSFLKTLILDANDNKNIKICADHMKTGGVVAFSTETVYGLGANALDAEAVSGIFDVKGRPADNPLIVHVASIDDVKPLVTDIPDIFKTLTEKFWPGPLTLIMRKSAAVPDIVTAGLDSVAVRMPEHPAALALIQEFGGPIAAPSANPSGKPSPTKAQHVKNDLNGKIPYILDGGDCKVGIESTVLDITGKVPRILRPGSVTYDELKNILGNIDIVNTKTGNELNDKIIEKPMSPGMKYRHYAPKVPLTAVFGPPEKTAEFIIAKVNDETGALMFDDHAIDHKNIITIGNSDDHEVLALNLFEALRKVDKSDITAIYAQVPNETGIGYAVADRIRKAAGDRIVVINMHESI